MDGFTLLIATALVTLLGLASVAWGVDSREDFQTGPDRFGVLR